MKYPALENFMKRLYRDVLVIRYPAVWKRIGIDDLCCFLHFYGSFGTPEERFEIDPWLYPLPVGGPLNEYTSTRFP